MISVNASTYLAAVEELERMFNSEALKEALASQNVTWDFIPKRAPWYGGFWEHIIGLTIQTVKKTLDRTFITLKQPEIVVTEVEAMLNDRPLTYVSSDVRDPEPLTPSHLLYGRRIRPIPCPLDSPDDLNDPDFVVSNNTIRQSVDRQANPAVLAALEVRISHLIERVQEHMKELSRRETSSSYMMTSLNFTGDWGL